MNQRQRESGLSSIELMAVAVVMSVLMVMVAESMRTLASVRGEQKASFTLGDVADRFARRVTADVDLAARVFTNRPEDVEYLAAVQFDSDIDPLSYGGRLPMLTAHGAFEPDPPGVPETGNLLFLARRGPTLQLEGPVLAVEHQHVKTFQWVVVVPAVVDKKADLFRFVSDPLVDYWELATLPQAQREDALQQLADAGIRCAWDPSAPRTTGLFLVKDGGSLIAMGAADRVRLYEDPTASRPFSTRRLGLVLDESDDRFKVPQYARKNSGFFGSFEVKIDGGDAGKLLLMRLVVETDTPQGHKVRGETRRVLNTRG